MVIYDNAYSNSSMMSSMQCPVPECTLEIGTEVPDDCKKPMLQIHLVYHQTLLQNASVKPEKLKRPTITIGNSTEDWNYFISRWGTYKSATKLSDSDLVIQLLECCDESLRKDLTRVHKSSLTNMTESDLISAIKRLSVVEESALVSRFNLHNMKQDIDEPIRSYVARIKGQAHICKLFVPCPNCNFLEVDFSDQIIRDVVTRGIVDDDIRLNLLGETNQDMSLEETVFL